MRILVWGAPSSGRATTVSAASGIERPHAGRDYGVCLPSGTNMSVAFSSLHTRPIIARAGSTTAATHGALGSIDGIAFVVDSQLERRTHNTEWLVLLQQTLSGATLDLAQVPIMFLANKRDLPSPMSHEQIRSDLQTPRCGYVDTVATKGIGITEAFELLAQMVLRSKHSL